MWLLIQNVPCSMWGLSWKFHENPFMHFDRCQPIVRTNAELVLIELREHSSMKLESTYNFHVKKLNWKCLMQNNNCDVIIGVVASQITSLTIVYSTVYSNADQRKHQSSASLAFVRRIHLGLVNSLHKWPVTRKMFPFDDVIMMSAILPRPQCVRSWSICINDASLVGLAVSFWCGDHSRCRLSQWETTLHWVHTENDRCADRTRHWFMAPTNTCTNYSVTLALAGFSIQLAEVRVPSSTSLT